MEVVELFSALVSLRLSGLVYFALAFCTVFIPACIRICYFNQAASISLILRKFRMVPAPGRLLPIRIRIVK